MNQDNNINQYINTSIDTKSHTGTELKRCSDIDEHNRVFDCSSAQRTGELWYCRE